MAAAATGLLLAGCGDAEPRPQAAAPPLEARVAISGNIPTATAGEFKAPIRTYRRHVRRQLAGMSADVVRLRGAVDRDDLAGARKAWLAADESYESIGAAYGAFGQLDARINGRPWNLVGGERSRHFTGLHRIELALWGRADTADARRPSAKLAADVRRLRAKVATAEIDPFEYSLRSHEVLEDTLHLQLAGVANRWSDRPLVALRGNVVGTQVVYGSLQRSVRRRNPVLANRVEQALQRLRSAIGRLASAGGALPTWSAMTTRERQRINAFTADAAERLAYVPELVDPRPPRPPQRALGTKAES